MRASTTRTLDRIEAALDRVDVEVPEEYQPHHWRFVPASQRFVEVGRSSLHIDEFVERSSELFTRFSELDIHTSWPKLYESRPQRVTMVAPNHDRFSFLIPDLPTDVASRLDERHAADWDRLRDVETELLCAIVGDERPHDGSVIAYRYAGIFLGDESRLCWPLFHSTNGGGRIHFGQLLEEADALDGPISFAVSPALPFRTAEGHSHYAQQTRNTNDLAHAMLSVTPTS